MMIALSRESIFKSSAFIDNQLSRAQMAIMRTVDLNDADEVNYTMSMLDHLKPFDPKPYEYNGFCVIAYPAIDTSDYENNFSGALMRFFDVLNISEIFMLTEINFDWKNFVFENEVKRSLFLTYANNLTNSVGYQFPTSAIDYILPLFYQHHPDSPSIGLINSIGDILLDMFMCKDGNLHVLYDEQQKPALLQAVETAGLISGSFEICQINRKGRI